MSSLPINPKDWNLENIITYLEKQKGKSFVEENNVRKKFEQQKINGISFLLLTEEMLSRKPGFYEFPHGVALEIAETIGKLNKERQEDDKIGKEIGNLVANMSKLSTNDTPDLDPAQNANKSAEVKLYQLYTSGYIKRNDPLLYYRSTAHGDTVIYGCKIEDIDDKGKITIISDISGKKSFTSLNDLEIKILEEDKQKNNRDIGRTAKAPLYFFVGKSITELKKKYAVEHDVVNAKEI
nr:15086_t:CDS:2 [Entrophospora candida]CAG8480588.1 6929_t:CDS:2 [Entrophospora candida]